ncbi:hypothetical protein CBER1_01185 [Cercospora berteroae]|uniref:Vacuolar protein sorting/targeting protein 10 n=1 Tax=Cercospora berteroae TaxID=357750 RepID=A0A2S6CIU6_9PEZI|nr:hypothetical protein CBER1_01185 [Cercospora berteroae]
MPQVRQLLGLLLLSVLALLAVAKDKPDVDEFNFHARPANLLYFEDSDVILATNPDTLVTFRSDDGGKRWKELDGVAAGEVMEVLKHPYDSHVAVVLGTKKTHWITHDRGEHWRAFTSPMHPTLSRAGISFHATDPDRMLFNAQKNAGFSREDLVYYTKDAFKTDMELLHKDVFSCLWAKSTEIFTTGDERSDRDTVLCIARGQFDFFKSHNRLIMSSDFFDKEEVEPTMSDGRTVEGITNLAAVKSYLVIAAKSERTTEMAMYVSDDTKMWHRAEFGQHKLEEDAYTLLESTNYSMQVDVMTTDRSDPMGVLLTSNSNGTFFTKNIEHTNRNEQGFVDFEKMSNIQGIVMVNTVDNWKDVETKWGTKKKVVSHISFDDGRTWEDLKADGKTLHLHSVTGQRNMGRIFSSPAPGLVMGVGNTGSSLGDYDDGDLYVSDDAGLTWQKALSKPHIYEFGAQGSIMVAVEDAETNKIKWSLNHGKDWETTELEDKFRPLGLTTTPDSTSLKFLMIAMKNVDSKKEHFIYALDFNGLHETKCSGGDFEKWPARKDKDGKASCIMGHKQFFQRRKANAKCVVENKDFTDPEEKRENCECTEQDFECDFNFKREDGKCVKSGPIVPPSGVCDSKAKTFKGSSGYRLIPGNTCEGGVDLAKEIERDCTDTASPPASGKISTEVQKFKGDRFIEHYYMERLETNKGNNKENDETVLLRTDRREVWKTHDHGKKWEQILEDEEILAIYPHQYINDIVYFITPSKKVHYSKDFAQSLHSFEAPEGPNQDRIQVLTFHPQEKDWLIWTGGRECKSDADCQTIAHVSRKGGDDWETLIRGVRKCQFVYREDRPKSDQLIYCEQHTDESKTSPLILMSSDDWFSHKTELKRDVVNFATMAEFIVVAVRDETEQSLRVDASIDGVTFAEAKFPANFKVDHQTAYTVLDSSTHAVFLHVTVNDRKGQEYGSIIKSNSNGTSYVLSAAEVNRNEEGYVDFEKMQGLEGVAIINRVANRKEADGGSSKKLQTFITHNDGADWALIGRPDDPPKEIGKPFECQGKSNQRCSLHLHGYTERKDPRDTYSSPSAVGLMLGTGNVGEYLGSKEEANTFITRDGGIIWHMIAEGNWMWEYGDQGSIIVIVKEGEPTGEVRYTLDEGQTWHTHDFGETMVVQDITTVPSDTSRNFLLWGKIGSSIATINIDFSGMTERSKQCKLDEQRPESEDSDYDLWSPSHPFSEENCLFGHVGQYHRKKPERDCFNGKEIKHLHNIAKNCSCARNDFECDFNYQRDGNGACTLVEGLSPPDPAEVCKKNPDLIEFNQVTGYRKIPLSTCEGGRELDKTSTPYPCPGHQEEFKKKHSISGAGLFFAIVLPIAAAAGVGYWVWKNWDGKFGRIRLGDTGYGGGGAFDSEAPWVKYPVMLISGVIALVATLPMVVGSLWKTLATRFGRSSGYGYSRTYTTRSSFQRGRGDYAVVDEDEGELLGEDSDEDV